MIQNSALPEIFTTVLGISSFYSKNIWILHEQTAFQLYDYQMRQFVHYPTTYKMYYSNLAIYLWILRNCTREYNMLPWRRRLKFAMSAITRNRWHFSVNDITIQSNLTAGLSSINLSIIWSGFDWEQLGERDNASFKLIDHQNPPLIYGQRRFNLVLPTIAREMVQYFSIDSFPAYVDITPGAPFTNMA